MFCCREQLFNWLNKSSKLGSGLNTTELFSFDISLFLLLSAEEEKPFSVKFQNGRIVLNIINKTKDQLIFADI